MRRFDISREPPEHRLVRLSSLVSTTLTATLLVAITSPSARAADDVPTAPVAGPTATFSVVEIGPGTLPRSLTADLEAAAAAGLAAAGAKVVARVPASPGEPGPNTLLRGTCQVDGSTYRLHLMLEDAQTGATLVARDDVCEICTEKDAADAVNIAASALKTKLDHTPRTLPEQAAKPTAPLLDTKPQPAPRPTMRARLRRILPWVAVGVGAVGMGVGAYYLATDGKAIDCKTGGLGQVCGRSNDSKAWGIEGLAIGAAVAATGLVFVLIPPRATEAPKAAAPPPRTLGLTLLPNAVSAWGTF